MGGEKRKVSELLKVKNLVEANGRAETDLSGRRRRIIGGGGAAKIFGGGGGVARQRTGPY